MKQWNLCFSSCPLGHGIAPIYKLLSRPCTQHHIQTPLKTMHTTSHTFVLVFALLWSYVYLTFLLWPAGKPATYKLLSRQFTHLHIQTPLKTMHTTPYTNSAQDIAHSVDRLHKFQIRLSCDPTLPTFFVRKPCERKTNILWAVISPSWVLLGI